MTERSTPMASQTISTFVEAVRTIVAAPKPEIYSLDIMVARLQYLEAVIARFSPLRVDPYDEIMLLPGHLQPGKAIYRDIWHVPQLRDFEPAYALRVEWRREEKYEGFVVVFYWKWDRYASSYPMPVHLEPIDPGHSYVYLAPADWFVRADERVAKSPFDDATTAKIEAKCAAAMAE
mgnify:CR=1 FL=1